MNKARAASSFTQTTTDRSPRQQEVGKEEDHNNGGYLLVVPLVHSTRLQNIACGKITRDEILSIEREELHFYWAMLVGAPM